MSPEPVAVRDDIAREIMALHQESYGAGAKEIQVILADDVVIVLVDIDLSATERTLVGAEHRGVMTSMREAFQEAIAPTFTAIVEHATGRTVNSFTSHVSPEPLYSVEVFRLLPARE